MTTQNNFFSYQIKNSFMSAGWYTWFDETPISMQLESFFKRNLPIGKFNEIYQATILWLKMHN
jgi:hypothetical protein